MYEWVERSLTDWGMDRDDLDPMVVQEIADHYSDLGLVEGTVPIEGTQAIYRYIVERKVPFTTGRRK